MIHALFGLDRPGLPGPVEATRQPKIIKLIMYARDLDEPMSLTMYNVVREGLSVAGKVLARGRTIGIEVQEAPGGGGWYRSISTAKELEPWKDSINRVVLVSHPLPGIESRETQSRRAARQGLFPDTVEIGVKPAT